MRERVIHSSSDIILLIGVTFTSITGLVALFAVATHAL
jgi:hypothetical protein